MKKLTFIFLLVISQFAIAQSGDSINVDNPWDFDSTDVNNPWGDEDLVFEMVCSNGDVLVTRVGLLLLVCAATGVLSVIQPKRCVAEVPRLLDVT